MPSTVSEILERLSRLHPKNIDLSLDRIRGLLADLGNPHKNLPPVIHIAGTNGKGSTLAFIRAFMEQSKKSVHVYTSPHLVRFNERILLNGREISDSHLERCLTRVENINAGRPLTFFEATTAAAFLAFSETPADFVLLETGMGGRLDATNVVESPALTLIASLSMDHEDYLGHTLKEIAAEKAAIFKTGTPALAMKALPEAAEVLNRFAKDRNVLLKIQGKDWEVLPREDGFLFNGTLFPPPALKGVHQFSNAGLAIAAVKELNAAGLCSVSDENIADGLKSVRWAGRLERLSSYPLPDGWELWVDGGHNAGAAAALAEFLPQWSDKPLHIICGMLKSKDSAAFLKQLAPFAASFHAVTAPDGTSAGRTAEELAHIAESSGFRNPETGGNIPETIETLTSGRYPAGRILICGSLYLLGRFFSFNRGINNGKK